MKKIKPFHECDLSCFTKTFRIMRITLFLMLAFIIQTFANEAYSQKTKLSLDYTDTRLEVVLDEIEELSEFFFLANEKLVNLDRSVNLTVENKKIDEILDMLFAGTDVVYTITDRKIILAPSFLTEDAQQQRSVSGKVTDSSGLPLPGVTVVVKGTTQGTVTNVDGDYTLPNIPEDATLVFSFVGMRTQEVFVGNQTTINASLEEETIGIEEVVAVGYGTMKKSDLTGSVVQITSDELEKRQITRADEALMGKMAGVQVTIPAGKPGEDPLIRIRGVGSISAGGQPLFVVDGFPSDNIQMLNPNDIETMDVLKDASATAIYGSRGSNGVVIITTKRGKEGPAIIKLDSYFGWQKVAKEPEYLTMEEQADYYYLGIVNQNLDAGRDISGDPTTWYYKVPHTIMDVIEGRNNVDEDAYKHIFQVAPIQSYNLSAQGGSKNIKYSVSGQYYNQEGIIIKTDFQRYSVRGNIDAQLTDRLEMSVNLNSSYITRDDARVVGGSGDAEGIVGAATTWMRWYPIYKEDGSYFSGYGQDATNNVWNPVAQANEILRKEQRSMTSGNLFLRYEFSKELQLSTMLGARTSNSRYFNFIPKLDVFSNVTDGSDSRSNYLNWITETTLNYNKSINNHNISALAGYTTQKQEISSNYVRSRDYPNNLVYTLNAANNIIYQGNSEESAWSMLSYLTRINYNYNNRYYVTVSVRADGSSRFGRNKKFGYFPSGAISWRVSEESFLQNFNFLNDLKLRASYGETGNNNIGNYAHLALINYESYTFGGNAVGGFAPSNIENPELTWEQQKSINLGLDVSLFSDNRINFSVEHYNTRNHNLLLNVYVPLITGFNTSLQNIGEVENKGWEFSLNTRNIISRNFKWNTNFNISTFKNKVLKLGTDDAPIISSYHITEVGQPMGMFYGYIADGHFKSQAELDAGPIWAPGTSDASRVGDIRFVDVSGPDGVPDGVINTFDRTIMGNPYPDFYWGMTNDFSYKNFSLNIIMQGSHGNDVFNASDSQLYTRARYKQLSIVKDYWKSESEPGTDPRPNNLPKGGLRQKSTRYITDGSYIKISNIKFGYSFSDQVANKLSLGSLGIYVAAKDPILITNFLYFNPEVSSSSNPLNPGVYNYDYPSSKNLTIGINATF